MNTENLILQELWKQSNLWGCLYKFMSDTRYLSKQVQKRKDTEYRQF